MLSSSVVGLAIRYREISVESGAAGCVGVLAEAQRHTQHGLAIRAANPAVAGQRFCATSDHITITIVKNGT